MKNKEKFSKEIIDIIFNSNFDFYNLGVSIQTKKPSRCNLLKCNDCIFNIKTKDNISCEDLAREWLEQEYVEPILNEAEKEFLSDFIKPIKDNVKGITKVSLIKNKECIIIDYDVDGKVFHCNTPWVLSNNMLKGMELYKTYTLEELGL